MAKCMENDPNGGYHLIKKDEIAFWEDKDGYDIYVRKVKGNVIRINAGNAYTSGNVTFRVVSVVSGKSNQVEVEMLID